MNILIKLDIQSDSLPPPPGPCLSFPQPLPIVTPLPLPPFLSLSLSFSPLVKFRLLSLYNLIYSSSSSSSPFPRSLSLCSALPLSCSLFAFPLSSHTSRQAVTCESVCLSLCLSVCPSATLPFPSFPFQSGHHGFPMAENGRSRGRAILNNEHGGSPSPSGHRSAKSNSS